MNILVVAAALLLCIDAISIETIDGCIIKRGFSDGPVEQFYQFRGSNMIKITVKCSGIKEEVFQLIPTEDDGMQCIPSYNKTRIFRCIPDYGVTRFMAPSFPRRLLGKKQTNTFGYLNFYG